MTPHETPLGEASDPSHILIKQVVFKIEIRMTARRWACTLYEHDPREDLKHGVTAGSIRLAVGQLERCPTTGRTHWQFYIELDSPRRRGGVTRLVGDPRTHAEICKGSREQNIAYCTKDESLDGAESRFEYGERSAGGQGRRNDIHAALDVIKKGVTPETFHALYEDHGQVMVKYNRGMSAAVSHYLGRSPRGDPPFVFVHYGPTGTGKTYNVYDKHPVSDVWRAPVAVSGSQWFDGYLGQKVALFDDFDGHHPAITVMLQVLDRYPLTVPVKGGHVTWLPRFIYITSNLKPDDWYPESGEAHRKALKRRFTQAIYHEYIHHDPNPNLEIAG